MSKKKIFLIAFISLLIILVVTFFYSLKLSNIPGKSVVFGYQFEIEDYRSIENFSKLKCAYCYETNDCKPELANSAAKTILFTDKPKRMLSWHLQGYALTKLVNLVYDEDTLANIIFSNLKSKEAIGLKDNCIAQFGKNCASLNDTDLFNLALFFKSRNMHWSQNFREEEAQKFRQKCL